MTLSTGRSALNASHPIGTSTMLPLSRIRKGDNPRRYFDRRKHDELVVSVRRRGVLQPILLRPTNDPDESYAIVAGERRYRAALEVFGTEGRVPVVIREMTDQEALEAAIDENDVRDDASETEQADAAVRVLAASQNDRAEAAGRLGWTKAKLDRRLELANLAEPVKRALDERRITVGHAELLAAVPADKQDKALETILASGLDVGKTRDLLMRVTQNLANACFDKTECTTCPFNSGAQRALFETHVDDGHCTNPGCFQLKTEAFEKNRLVEQKSAPTTAPPPVDDDEDHEETEHATTLDAQGRFVDDGSFDTSRTSASSPSNSGAAGRIVPTAPKPTVTARLIAGRTLEFREASWRTAVARALASQAAHARTAILVAAMSGTLSQIKAETLKERAALLIDVAFTDLDYSGKIAQIRELSDSQAANVLASIGAAYARDVLSFGHVADLARAYAIDLRDSWQVDKAFLERYTKDELKFIAHECGLVAHIGAKAFARLLATKKADLVAGMISATRFDWAGRLPSAMTLDGQYGPPPFDIRHQTEAPIIDVAA